MRAALLNQNTYLRLIGLLMTVWVCTGCLIDIFPATVDVEQWMLLSFTSMGCVQNHTAK